MDGYCTRVMREGGRGKRRTRKGKRGRKNGGRSLEEKTSMNMEKVSGHFTCSIFEKWCEINDAKAVRSSLRMEGGGREEKSSSTSIERGKGVKDDGGRPERAHGETDRHEHRRHRGTNDRSRLRFD